MSGPTHEERNALILRRTLSALCWIYAFWSGLFGVLALGLAHHTEGPYDARLILAHAGLLVLAGALTWKPRRGAPAAVLLACAGSLVFIALDLQRRQWETAFMDGLFIPLALLLLIKSRRPS
ncbi:MAG TPA: hypothetical protein VE981_12355 [Planctomycetota bacterium]|nr:hypothetical protein [Planctomycetota bacterium]